MPIKVREKISATKAKNRVNAPEKQTTIAISLSLKNRLEVVAASEHCTVLGWIEKRVSEAWPRRYDVEKS